MNYYWVVDYKQSRDGVMRPIVIGGRSFTSEMKAQSYIDNALLTDNAEIFALPTSNVARATRMIKAKLVERLGHRGKGEWVKGLKRAVHTGVEV